MKLWQFWIDRGGTFTDIIGISPAGEICVEKILSDNPVQSNAAVAGMRKILGGIAPSKETVECVKIGTTVATNALLERKGEPTVLVTNRGFADVLRIAYQNRPHIFARHILLPQQLNCQTVEVDCRYSAQGEQLHSIDERRVRADLGQIFESGVKSCAIVFMHGHAFPKHENQVGEIAAQIGFTQISKSHEVSALIKIVGRGDTCVADAYLSPVLRRYVEQLQSQLPGVELMFMQSNGGLTIASGFNGKDSLLSGPAGGLVGAVSTCANSGFEKIISFDMGGTSTDVGHYAGSYESTADGVLAGVRVRVPMLSVNTVAAGGGSICKFENGRLQVGPDSAGALPGPACYGHGGPLTITDCNVLLGRLQPQFFPSVFGADGASALSRAAVVDKFAQLIAKLKEHFPAVPSPEAVAESFIDIAVEKMAAAIKQISIEKGHDLRQYALASFGGAAGQHACRIADLLGIEYVISHPLAGVLSALGIGLSPLKMIKQSSLEKLLDCDLLPVLETRFQSLQTQVTASLIAQAPMLSEQIKISRLAYLKYEGTDFSLPVPHGSLEQMSERFNEIHRDRFRFLMDGKQLVVDSISVEGVADVAPALPNFKDTAATIMADFSEVYIGGKSVQVPLRTRSQLSGEQLSGPAIIVDSTSTTVVEPGWCASLDETLSLILKRVTARTKKEESAGDRPDPARLELFNHAFMAIAEQMGAALQSTSYSVNIKERLDFSCAVFDSEGCLVANAPHIPVHLGSMSDCVRAIIEKNRSTMMEGDTYVSNNPYAGGTHLPDITVVSPVYVPVPSASSGAGADAPGADVSDCGASGSASNDGLRPAFFTAARGHHADVGGISPGSMPAMSRSINDEGVVIDNFLLVSEGHFREKEILRLLAQGEYPARQPQQNVADLRAQVAANVRGAQALARLVEEHGLMTVQKYMRFIQENSAQAVRNALRKLNNGSFQCTMDDGAIISVDIQIDQMDGTAVIDFTGSAGQQNNNMNAPAAITKAAVMYVLRTLIEEEIPLNDGFLSPVSIKLAPRSILNPSPPAAIVAGNVETSQQITDALYGALNAMAASQGTMNNFTFGNQRYQYYETIAGGSGAGPDFDGTSAVQTNMTNSRLTDPEVLELRFPVLLESFCIRQGSGGAGKHRGGDGVVRRIKFLDRMTVSILSQRRVVPPFGLAGGLAGACGNNTLIKAGGEKIQLGFTDTVEVDAGDTIIIETPGGGGFASANGDSGAAS